MAKQLDFLVARQDLRRTEWREQPLSETLETGQLLLAVDTFALTANNITYGVAGDSMNYWQFFPVDDTWGRIPVWGFADVVASAHPDVSVGERLYGYYPMSSHLVIQADRVTERQLMDVSAHRQGLAAVYNQYQRVAADPGYLREAEDAQMLYRPLFTTSFLIDDFLADSGFFGAEQVVLTSASSKTSLGLAYLLHANRADQIQVIGLTSAANVAFVEGLGCYHGVLSYEEIDRLGSQPTVLVDMAGNGQVLAAVHNHLDEALLYSCLVGATHWDARKGAREMAGPAPEMFFAPSHVEKRLKEWGGSGFESRLSEAWAGFSSAASRWITVEHGSGREAVEKVYQLMLENRASPDHGHVLRVLDRQTA